MREAVHRILFVWPYLQYLELAIENLRKMRDRGYEISVLVGGNRQDVSYYHANRGGIDFHLVPSIDVFGFLTKTPYPIFVRVASLIKNIRPDVVHINSHLFVSSYQVARAAKSLDLPTVLTVHGTIAERGLFLNLMQELWPQESQMPFKKVRTLDEQVSGY